MTVNVKKLSTYWKEEANYSWEVAQSLWEKRKYPECLFFGHLTLEKILKAIIIIHSQDHAPPLHDLVKLAQKTGLIFNREQLQDLADCSDFYLAGRYDEDKMEFRKKCTHEFAAPYFKLIERYYVWLKKEIFKASQPQ